MDDALPGQVSEGTTSQPIARLGNNYHDWLNDDKPQFKQGRLAPISKPARIVLNKAEPIKDDDDYIPQIRTLDLSVDPNKDLYLTQKRLDLRTDQQYEDDDSSNTRNLNWTADAAIAKELQAAKNEIKRSKQQRTKDDDSSINSRNLNWDSDKTIIQQSNPKRLDLRTDQEDDYSSFDTKQLGWNADKRDIITKPNRGHLNLTVDKHNNQNEEYDDADMKSEVQAAEDAIKFSRQQRAKNNDDEIDKGSLDLTIDERNKLQDERNHAKQVQWTADKKEKEKEVRRAAKRVAKEDEERKARELEERKFHEMQLIRKQRKEEEIKKAKEEEEKERILREREEQKIKEIQFLKQREKAEKEAAVQKAKEEEERIARELEERKFHEIQLIRKKREEEEALAAQKAKEEEERIARELEEQRIREIQFRKKREEEEAAAQKAKEDEERMLREREEQRIKRIQLRKQGYEDIADKADENAEKLRTNEDDRIKEIHFRKQTDKITNELDDMIRDLPNDSKKADIYKRLDEIAKTNLSELTPIDACIVKLKLNCVYNVANGLFAMPKLQHTTEISSYYKDKIQIFNDLHKRILAQVQSPHIDKDALQPILNDIDNEIADITNKVPDNTADYIKKIQLCAIFKNTKEYANAIDAYHNGNLPDIQLSNLINFKWVKLKKDLQKSEDELTSVDDLVSQLPNANTDQIIQIHDTLKSMYTNKDDKLCDALRKSKIDNAIRIINRLLDVCLLNLESNKEIAINLDTKIIEFKKKLKDIFESPQSTDLLKQVGVLYTSAKALLDEFKNKETAFKEDYVNKYYNICELQNLLDNLFSIRNVIRGEELRNIKSPDITVKINKAAEIDDCCDLLKRILKFNNENIWPTRSSKQEYIEQLSNVCADFKKLYDEYKSKSKPNDRRVSIMHQYIKNALNLTINYFNDVLSNSHDANNTSDIIQSWTTNYLSLKKISDSSINLDELVSVLSNIRNLKNEIHLREDINSSVDFTRIKHYINWIENCTKLRINYFDDKSTVSEIELLPSSECENIQYHERKNNEPWNEDNKEYNVDDLKFLYHRIQTLNVSDVVIFSELDFGIRRLITVCNAFRNLYNEYKNKEKYNVNPAANIVCQSIKNLLNFVITGINDIIANPYDTANIRYNTHTSIDIDANKYYAADVPLWTFEKVNTSDDYKKNTILYSLRIELNKIVDDYNQDTSIPFMKKLKLRLEDLKLRVEKFKKEINFDSLGSQQLGYIDYTDIKELTNKLLYVENLINLFIDEHSKGYTTIDIKLLPLIDCEKISIDNANIMDQIVPTYELTPGKDSQVNKYITINNEVAKYINDFIGRHLPLKHLYESNIESKCEELRDFYNKIIQETPTDIVSNIFYQCTKNNLNWIINHYNDILSNNSYWAINYNGDIIIYENSSAVDDPTDLSRNIHNLHKEFYEYRKTFNKTNNVNDLKNLKQNIAQLKVKVDNIDLSQKMNYMTHSDLKRIIHFIDWINTSIDLKINYIEKSKPNEIKLLPYIDCNHPKLKTHKSLPSEKSNIDLFGNDHSLTSIRYYDTIRHITYYLVFNYIICPTNDLDPIFKELNKLTNENLSSLPPLKAYVLKLKINSLIRIANNLASMPTTLRITDEVSAAYAKNRSTLADIRIQMENALSDEKLNNNELNHDELNHIIKRIHKLLSMVNDIPDNRADYIIREYTLAMLDEYLKSINAVIDYEQEHQVKDINLFRLGSKDYNTTPKSNGFTGIIIGIIVCIVCIIIFILACLRIIPVELMWPSLIVFFIPLTFILITLANRSTKKKIRA